MENPNRGTQQHQGRSPGGGAGTRTAEPEGVIGTVTEKASEIASSAASMAGDAWEATRHGAQQAASAVATTAGDAYDDVADFLRRYPMATLCLGLGVGFLFGCAFRSTGIGSHLRSDWAGYPSLSSGGQPYNR